MQLSLNKLLMLTILLAAVEISGSEAAGFQTGLCGRGEGERDENPCTELGEMEDCHSRHISRKDGSTSACDEVYKYIVFATIGDSLRFARLIVVKLTWMINGHFYSTEYLHGIGYLSFPILRL